MNTEKKVQTGNSFSISESEAIGISCFEKPSLSVMYPNMNEAAVILSYSKVYCAATFVKVLGKEYLAVPCWDNACLYLWDIESKTSKKVFDPKLQKDQIQQSLNIFRINDNSIGYEVCTSHDRSSRVFILKTDTKELTLSSTPDAHHARRYMGHVLHRGGWWYSMSSAVCSRRPTDHGGGDGRR